jgi:hypothetical protein
MTDGEKPLPTVRWAFVRRRDAEDIWFWQRIDANGLIEAVSDGQHGLGMAVVDAVQSGFQAATHPWLISDAEWITYFEQGNKPRSVRREPTTIPGGPYLPRHRPPEVSEDTQRDDTPILQPPTQQQEQSQSFRFLSHEEFSALATEQEKAAYISRAMIELGRMDLAKKRG